MDRAERVFDTVVHALARLAAAVFVGIAASIPVDLILRNGFGASIYGLLDAIEYGLLVATFLAAPWVLSINAHVSVDLFVCGLRGRARRVADTLANLVGACAAGVFLWFAVVAMTQSFERETMIRTAFVIPEWWVLAVAPASMALILVEFARRIMRGTGTGTRTGL